MKTLEFLGHDVRISGGFSSGDWEGRIVRLEEDRAVWLRKGETLQFISLPSSFSITHRETKCERCQAESQRLVVEEPNEEASGR